MPNKTLIFSAIVLVSIMDLRSEVGNILQIICLAIQTPKIPISSIQLIFIDIIVYSTLAGACSFISVVQIEGDRVLGTSEPEILGSNGLAILD